MLKIIPHSCLGRQSRVATSLCILVVTSLRYVSVFFLGHVWCMRAYTLNIYIQIYMKHTYIFPFAVALTLYVLCLPCLCFHSILMLFPTGCFLHLYLWSIAVHQQRLMLLSAWPSFLLWLSLSSLLLFWALSTNIIIFYFSLYCPFVLLFYRGVYFIAFSVIIFVTFFCWVFSKCLLFFSFNVKCPSWGLEWFLSNEGSSLKEASSFWTCLLQTVFWEEGPGCNQANRNSHYGTGCVNNSFNLN